MKQKERIQAKIQKNEELLASINKKIEVLGVTKQALTDKLEAQRFALKHCKEEILKVTEE